MGCGCEKDKAKKECNDFTKAVINIENPEVLTIFHKVVIPASMGDEETVPPAIGKYRNTLLYYEASGNSYLYSSDGIPTEVTGKDGKDGKDGADGRDGTDGRDGAIQYTAGTGISISAQNVISATGSASVSWGDIAGDLDDQTDLANALGGKQDTLTAGANIAIDADNVISATDTTYTHFTGTDGQTDGTQGLVPAPLTTDVDKFLSANGTWQTPPGTTYTAGANITIDANNEISATDTTYSNFTGTDGVSGGTAGLVPGPTTSDTDKYLKSDGTWATVASGGSTITMTNTDPGEGQPLAADNFIAVYGSTDKGGFSRYTANQSIPAATNTTLLPSTTQATDDGVSYSNGVVSIQKAGWWTLFTTVGGSQSSNGYLTVEIVVNNVVVASASGSTTGGYTHCRNVSWAGKLSVGDTVKVQVTTQSAMSITKRDRGVFSGVLISAD